MAFGMISWVFFGFEYLKFLILNKIYSFVFKYKKLSKNLIGINYVYNNKNFYYPLKRNLKPQNCIIKKVIYKSRDITDEFIKLMGPYQDFYNYDFSPKSLGYSGEIIVITTTQTFLFGEDDLLKNLI